MVLVLPTVDIENKTTSSHLSPSVNCLRIKDPLQKLLHRFDLQPVISQHTESITMIKELIIQWNKSEFRLLRYWHQSHNFVHVWFECAFKWEKVKQLMVREHYSHCLDCCFGLGTNPRYSRLLNLLKDSDVLRHCKPEGGVEAHLITFPRKRHVTSAFLVRVG